MQRDEETRLNFLRDFVAVLRSSVPPVQCCLVDVRKSAASPSKCKPHRQMDGVGVFGAQTIAWIIGAV
jgi:hypothetical protein